MTFLSSAIFACPSGALPWLMGSLAGFMVGFLLGWGWRIRIERVSHWSQEGSDDQTL